MLSWARNLVKMDSKGEKGRIFVNFRRFSSFFRLYDVTKGPIDENWVVRFSSNFYTILIIWTSHREKKSGP